MAKKSFHEFLPGLGENFVKRTRGDKGKKGRRRVQLWQGESPSAEVSVAGYLDHITNIVDKRSNHETIESADSVV